MINYKFNKDKHTEIFRKEGQYTQKLSSAEGTMTNHSDRRDLLPNQVIEEAKEVDKMIGQAHLTPEELKKLEKALVELNHFIDQQNQKNNSQQR